MFTLRNVGLEKSADDPANVVRKCVNPGKRSVFSVETIISNIRCEFGGSLALANCSERKNVNL
jgi:hypothetical protein